MKNIVPCKICQKDFEYIPGSAGNARQFCSECRKDVDEEEMAKLKEEMTLENNRYLLSAPGRKDEYDPTEILVDGELPELENDADKFVCTMEVAYFVRRTGITGIEDNLAKFLEYIGPTHQIVFLRQQKLNTVERMTNNKGLKAIIKNLVKLVT